jgi:hypothetical protein
LNDFRHICQAKGWGPIPPRTASLPDRETQRP